MEIKTVRTVGKVVFPKDSSFLFAVSVIENYEWKSACTAIDFDEADTSGVENMRGMFCGCGSLKTLDVSKFRTSKATTMRSMFNSCKSLTALDVSGFDTTNATNLSFMFWGCGSLTSLDLRSFDTAKAEQMEKMFDGCSALKTVRLGAKFSFKGKGAAVQAALPDKQWVSASSGLTYSARQIAEKRSGIADTYTAK